MQNELLLSIIIPVYNLDKYIERCLYSILNAELPNYEIICINDGSTDNSYNIIDSIANQHVNITVISRGNKGVSATRNEGILLAKGRYVWFIDGDDYIEATTVNGALLALDSETDIHCINFDYVDETTLNTSYNTSFTKKGVYNIEDFIKHNYNYKGMPWAFIIKKELIVNNGVTFDISMRYYEDEQFIYKLLSYASIITADDVVVYHYLMRPTSALRTASEYDRLSDAINIYTDLVKFSKNKSDYFKDFINKRAAHTFCWAMRNLDDDGASKYYGFLQAKNVLPLKPAGPLKTKIQVRLLNLNFTLFRLFSKIIRYREKAK